ncbi:MAG: ABC transporter ATP-binding protein [Fimbriimonadales bacterium]
MSLAIHAEGLCKDFVVTHQAYGSLKGLLLSFLPRRREKVRALDALDLSIEAGETVAVVGKNGAGKSTLLGIVARVYRPTSGRIAVSGRVAPLLELGAGFHPDLTGVENVFFNGVILGLTRREVAARLDEIVAFADLHEYIDAPIRTYSSGMLMRLGFAVATHVDADILLVDEVLAVGDLEFQAKCYAKIAEFQRQGKTILFVSHDLDAVSKTAPRTLWLDSGRLRLDGPTSEVLSEYQAATARDPSATPARGWVSGKPPC